MKRSVELAYFVNRGRSSWATEPWKSRCESSNSTSSESPVFKKRKLRERSYSFFSTKWRRRMGQCEGESFRKCCSRFPASTSEFYATASKCANYSAAAIATSAARSAAIASTNTTSTTITKLGAVANTTGKTERISNKDMGKCIIKRGWWSR